MLFDGLRRRYKVYAFTVLLNYFFADGSACGLLWITRVHSSFPETLV